MRYASFALVILSAASLTACAYNYRPPEGVAVPQTVVASVPAESLHAKLVRMLSTKGYQVAFADQAAGIITTAPKLFQSAEPYVDLGTTLGLAYVKDERTIVHAVVNLAIDGTKVTITTQWTGKYLEADVSQSKNMVGVSSGKLEKEIAAEIAALKP